MKSGIRQLFMHLSDRVQLDTLVKAASAVGKNLAVRLI